MPLCPTAPCQGKLSPMSSQGEGVTLRDEPVSICGVPGVGAGPETGRGRESHPESTTSK